MKRTSIPVWDIAVRIFHWSLVVAFVIAYLTGEDDSALHVYSGYAVLALVVFRVLWGFFGSRHARFRNFVRGPGAVAAYFMSLITGCPAHFRGHNPAGGWMVIAFLTGLLATTVSGLKLYGIEGHGPLAAASPTSLQVGGNGIKGARQIRHVSENDEEFWEEMHEVCANLTVALIIFHVLGVIISSRLHRENLLKAIITGKKEIESV